MNKYNRNILGVFISAFALASGSAAEAKWVASWAAGSIPPGPKSASFSNQTLRQVVRLSAGGDALRVRLTNAFGTAPLAIGAARIVFLDDSGREIAGTARELTFAGASDATIARGAPLLSDSVKIAVPTRARMAISLYLPGDSGPCTCHNNALDDTEVSAPGDFTAGPFEPAAIVKDRAFLASVDVDAPGDAATVVAFGDSITNGTGSTWAANRRWPDQLADRLADRGDRVWGIANAGISGNRVMGDGTGESALTRLDRDVFSLPNVKMLILFEGINDIGRSYARYQGEAAQTQKLLQGRLTDASQMIAAYRQIIDRAHQHDIKVFGATIAPFKGASYWSPEGEAVRQEINRFIRTSGAFDAVLDFDRALADPADPASMRADYHSGDHLHGSDAGYAAVVQSIDLQLFR
ncbi:MAG TPA: SGNH/GDSL hydrolase family protein [Sphingopyxis sp.]|uniref:SGNH/GDSL hydrolase family protein n=1 Tax=Sphingopyxis sp. TaxID=1908224 RepID=UPI002D07A2E9|nr:SGNH/GDSL hydrolase family protein [Sphingopyxis sp.]HWW56292.1 SGNH/GDSL hydrolase family protein [Sphingopyxis sp.]